jgi:hypothetical protein
MVPFNVKTKLVHLFVSNAVLDLDEDELLSRYINKFGLEFPSEARNITLSSYCSLPQSSIVPESLNIFTHTEKEKSPLKYTPSGKL